MLRGMAHPPKRKKPTLAKLPQPRLRNKLTPKQARFSDAYLKYGSAALALRSAIPHSKANSRTMARAGWAMLRHPTVSQYLKIRMEQMVDRFQIKQEAVLAEIVKLAFSTPMWFAEWNDGKLTLHDSNDLDPGLTGAIKSISSTPHEHGNRIELQLHPKTEALKILAQYFKILSPDQGFGSSMAELSEAYRIAEQKKAGMLRQLVKDHGSIAITEGWSWQNGVIHDADG